MFRRLLPISCACVIFLLAQSACQADPAVLRVEGTARQGGVLFVTLSREPGARVHFLGQDVALVPDGPQDSVMRAVLAIPIDTRPADYALTVDAGSGDPLHRVVRVARGWFPHQSITLPPAMLATYDSPRNKKDDALLLAAARVFTPTRAWRGAFRLPARGPFGTHFGQQRTYNGWRKGWHKGVDIEAAAGAPIVATQAGTVAVVAPHQVTNGNATLIDHGIGVFSLYMHQSRIDVRPGQAVRQGRLIGRVGATGAGTGPHLHWQCFVHGIPVDPLAFLHVPRGW